MVSGLNFAFSIPSTKRWQPGAMPKIEEPMICATT